MLDKDPVTAKRQNIDDTTLTATVKTKLSVDKLANLTRIDVDTYNGVVSLNGVVSSPEEKATRGRDRANRKRGQESRK